MGRFLLALPEGEMVTGVTSLDNHLFVLRAKSSQQDQVEIYDINTCRLLRCVTVPGLGNTDDMVACGHHRCAYISDQSHDSIHRLALPDATIVQWPVDETPAGLSVSNRHRLLVSCWKVRKIKEFSTDGELLHVLCLTQDVLSPLHAIQLSSGQLIVSHGVAATHLHRVCLIGTDNHVVKSFGGPKGSGVHHMNMPYHLAVDGNGFVFVADLANGRVLLLSPQLTYVREVVSHKQLRWSPRGVHLDSTRGRLYVTVGVGRVMVVSLY